MLQPAIQLADEGFAATPRFVASPNCAGDAQTSRARNSPLAAETFCPGGQAIPAGTVVTHKPLAETLRLIATHGADCFYKVDLAKGCDIALGIVEGQSWNRPQAPGGKGGSMTLADLAAYQPAVRAPIEGRYRGYTLKSMAPPSSGALTVLQILKMLERFPLGDASSGFGFGSVNTLNVMADAMRLAFADRGGVDGRRRLRAGARQGPAERHLPGRARCRHRAGRAGCCPATLLSADPRPFETARPRTGPAPGRGRTGPGHRERHHALLGGRQVGQCRQLHQHHRSPATASACSPATSAPTAASATTASC